MLKQETEHDLWQAETPVSVYKEAHVYACSGERGPAGREERSVQNGP